MVALRDVVGILLCEYDTYLVRNLRPIETTRAIMRGNDLEEQLRVVLALLINFQMSGALAMRVSHEVKAKGLLRDTRLLQDAGTAREALAGVHFGEMKAVLVAQAFGDINRAGSVIGWLEKLRTGECRIGKGAPKVRSNLLKQTGYLDEAPVDVHVKRFVRRVARVDLPCGSRGERKLKELCSTQLAGLRHGNYDLGFHPGVLDKLIRIHCSPDSDEFGVPYRGICGASPCCEVCPVRYHCPKHA